MINGGFQIKNYGIRVCLKLKEKAGIDCYLLPIWAKPLTLPLDKFSFRICLWNPIFF